VTWTNGTDDGSITASSGDNTTIALTKQGSNTITFTVTDNASNTATDTAEIFVDTEAPTASENVTLALKYTGSSYDNSTNYSSSLTFVLDNETYATDGAAGTGLTHYLITDNVSENSTTISSSDSRWFSVDTISTDNLTTTISMNASENATINPGDTLTLTLFAKDALNNIGNIGSASTTFDNMTPDNTSAIIVESGTDNGSGYFVLTPGLTTATITQANFESFYGDNGSSILGYVLDDNSSAPSTLAGFTGNLEVDNLSSGNNALYLHVIDQAFNVTNELINVFIDSDSPNVSSASVTASYGGSDNTTHVLVPGINNSSVVLTFTVNATDSGGIKGYLISETSLKLSSLSGDFDSFTSAADGGLTYTLTDTSSYTTTTTKSFYVYVIDNVGEVAQAPSAVTVTIVPESRATTASTASTDGVRLLTGPAVSAFQLNGYADGDNQSIIDNGVVINKNDNITMRLSMTSDTSPVYGWRVSCDNVTNDWTNVGNYEPFGATDITTMVGNDNDSFKLDNFTYDLNLSLVDGCISNSTVEDGSKTIYVGIRSQGGTPSSITSDTITVDTTLPDIDNFTFADLTSDNYTHAKGGTVRFFLDFSDLNDTTTSNTTDNGTGVTYYIVSENATAPAVDDNRWTAVDNQTSHNDNITILTQSTSPGSTVKLYAWVKEMNTLS
jgi:hypothetical protein